MLHPIGTGLAWFRSNYGPANAAKFQRESGQSPGEVWGGTGPGFMGETGQRHPPQGMPGQRRVLEVGRRGAPSRELPAQTTTAGHDSHSAVLIGSAHSPSASCNWPESESPSAASLAWTAHTHMHANITNNGENEKKKDGWLRHFARGCVSRSPPPRPHHQQHKKKSRCRSPVAHKKGGVV